jgi:hypothetical protein
MIGWFLDSKPVKPTTAIGTLIVLFGSAAYSYIRWQEDNTAKEKQSADKDKKST